MKLLILSIITMFVLSAATLTAAQRPLPTPPGAALHAFQAQHDHRPTATATKRPTATSTPSPTATRTATAKPVLYCMIVEMYVQNGQPLVEWKFSNYIAGYYWFGIIPANIQPVCVRSVF